MKKVFLLLLAGGIMMTACKKEEMKKENYVYKNGSISIYNPKFKLVKENYNKNGGIGNLYIDENNPIISLFEVESTTKQLFTKDIGKRSGKEIRRFIHVVPVIIAKKIVEWMQL
jgi:hypothetical protein